MLLLRRDRLKIGIARDRIELVRTTGWVRQTVVAHQIVTIGADVATDAQYPALLERLSEISRQEEWQNVDVTVLLSGGIARYSSFQKLADIRQTGELDIFARHHLAQIYGEVVNSWTIKLSVGKAGENIVCAVESTFLAALREIFSKKQQKLISIQPALMASFNLHKKELQDKGCYWFVLFEEGFLTYALIADGQWRYLQTRRGTGAHNLLQWLQRENLSGLAGVPCYEIWHAGVDQIDAEDSGFKFNALKALPCGDIDLKKYRLALYGGC